VAAFEIRETEERAIDHHVDPGGHEEPYGERPQGSHPVRFC
jgi:hypothetical protein